MNNDQILKSAILKAEKNGFKNWVPKEIMKPNYSNKPWVYYLIFSPQFAKAFFGKIALCMSCHKKVPCGCLNANAYGSWKFYQHEMLTELQEGRDPIKYLEQFLK